MCVCIYIEGYIGIIGYIYIYILGLYRDYRVYIGVIS